MGLNTVHLARLLRLLGHQGDKYVLLSARVARGSPFPQRFFPVEVLQAVKAVEVGAAVALINGVMQQNAGALAVVPPEVQASLVTAVRLFHLHQVFKALNAPQILALHR